MGTRRGRRARLTALTVAALLGSGLTAAAASPVADRSAPVGSSSRASAVAGSAGVGDPYFPLSGNGGFHVAHYALDLSYDPATHRLAGSAVLRAEARRSLSRFDLDLLGLTVRSVTVDGRPAGYRRSGQELIITPATVLARGHTFTVAVRYDGVPHFVTDPDGSPDGWITTDTGAFVGSEPQGAMTWFPANSHPVDKSAFDVTMTVPNGYLAVGNGNLVAEQRTAAGVTTHWRERQPMAAYLATASIARFQTTRYQVDGLPVFIAVDPREAAQADPVLARLPAIVRWERAVFGPYPFSATGAIVMHAPAVGYALETQTRPLFDRAPDTSTLVHELAHQWFGDSVSLRRWKDIWLNEGFATYAEWLWSEHTGGPTARQLFEQVYAEPATADVWSLPVANPGSGANIFGDPPYERGAMVLQKLRERVGDATFTTILRTWVHQHRFGHATTAQFTGLATRLSGQDLRGLFRSWLYTAGKPGRP